MLTWLARLFGFARGGAFDVHGGFGPLGEFHGVGERVVPTEAVQEKPVRRYQERIIAGLGSGDTSDINTYALADKLGMRKGTPLPRMRDRVMLNGIAPMDSAGTRDGLGDNPIPIDANAIADVMDHAYTRDPETKKLVLKDGLPVPDPKLEAGVTTVEYALIAALIVSTLAYAAWVVF